MAGGWAKDGAVQEQIEASVGDEIARARRILTKAGKGRETCADCDDPIPEARRAAIPGVTLCILCQSERDKTNGPAALFNRRGSKDSQLR